MASLKIPKYDIRVTPEAVAPSPEANIAAQTADIEATEKLGLTGARAGAVGLDIALDYQRKIQDDESRNWTLKARPEFKAELDKLEAEYAGKINGINDDGTRREYIRKAVELSDKYKNLAGMNNLSWEFLRPHIESDITAAGTKLGALSKATRQIATLSGLQQNFGIELGHAKDYGFSYDGKNFSIESQWKNYASMIMGSSLDPDDKQKKLLIEKPRFYQEYAQMMLGDPKTAGQFASILKNEGAFNAYMSHLPQGSQGDFQKALKTAATNSQNESLYNYLDTKYNISGATGTQKDFAGALKDLASQKLILAEGGTPVSYDVKQKMIVDIKEQQGIAEHQDIINAKKEVKALLDTSAKLQESSGASGAINFLRKTIRDPKTSQEVSIEADKEISRIKSELRADATLNIMSSDYKEKQEYKKAINKASGLVKPELINQVGVAMKKIMEDDPSLTPDQAASKLGHDAAWARKTRGLNLNPSATVTPTTPVIQKGATTATDAQGRKVMLVTQPDGTQKWEPIKGAK